MRFLLFYAYYQPTMSAYHRTDRVIVKFLHLPGVEFDGIYGAGRNLAM